MLAQDGSRPQAPRLAQRLIEARRRRFFGRDDELRVFRQALQASHPERPVFYVCGPAGIGKTGLLNEYEWLAQQAGRPLVKIDGQEVQSSGLGIRFALAEAMGLRDEDDPLSCVGAFDGAVLIIDNFDGIASLDSWLRERLFPLLPANGILVVAGRDGPPQAWQEDVGWWSLTQILALRNLTPEASRAVLSANGVHADQQDGILAYTHGHPLALHLAADASKGGRSARNLAAAGPDVIYPLLARFVADAPSDRHRKALEASAIAWRTTQPLLQAALNVDDSTALDLFEWLRALSFTERGAHGLFPHDLVREVVIEELRWRNPDALRALVRRISAAEARRFFSSRGREQHQALWALLFVTRNHPSMRPFYDWRTLGEIYGEPATPPDRQAIISMVARHEGPESARIAKYWWRRQPQAFSALRALSGELVGFVANILLDGIDAEAAAVDPAMEALGRFIKERCPLRGGEGVAIARFWMHDRDYQNTTAFNMGATLSTVIWMTEPRLALAFVVLRDPEFWLPMFRFVNFEAATGASFSAGGHSYGVVFHDWRVEPQMSWWRAMGERRETNLGAPGHDWPSPEPRMVVLSQPAFREAALRALRDYARPASLAANPLLRSRLVAERGGEALEALRALLLEAVDSLAGHPRDRKLHRALQQTYIVPARTQEAAAELLDLPFSTYRRHLKQGIEHVVNRLWQWELEGPPPGPPEGRTKTGLSPTALPAR